MRRIIQASLALWTVGLGLALGSCGSLVYDDLSKCPVVPAPDPTPTPTPGPTPQPTPQPTDGTVDIAISHKGDKAKPGVPEGVDKVTIKIYDKEGNHVGDHTVTVPTPTGGQNPELPRVKVTLPPGDYTAVVIGHKGDNPPMANGNPKGNLPGLRVGDPDGNKAQPGDPIYIAKTPITITGGEEKKDTISVNGGFTTFKTTVYTPDEEGRGDWFTSNKTGDPLTIVISNVPARLTPDGTPEGKITYTLTLKPNEEDKTFVGDFPVIKFDPADPNIVVELKKGSTVLCHEPVAEYIKKNNIPTGGDSPEVPMFFSQRAQGGLSVKVGPWRTVEVEPIVE